MKRTRYGRSPWAHEFPASRIPALPRFRGDRTADVVIIGGGLTGSATAYLCAAAGLTTILLEADRVGQGRSSRAPGLLTPDPGISFRALTAAHGLRGARRVFDAWRRGALDGAALLRRLRVKCDLGAREMLLMAGSESERDLRRDFDARHEADFDAAWVTRKQMQSRMKLDAAAGLRLRDGFALDPYRACLGLAAAARSAGAECYERSRVKRVRFTRKDAEVLIDQGKIRTQKVIVATGSATPEFRSLQRHFEARETYVVVTEQVPTPVRRHLGDPSAIVRDLRQPPTQVSWTRDDRLMVTGGDQKEAPERMKSAVLVQRTGQLMYELLKMYPAISGLKPEYGWDVPYGETADGLMYIGAHRNFPHHVFALGGRSSSVTGAFVAARILLRDVQGEPDKADEVFGWIR